LPDVVNRILSGSNDQWFAAPASRGLMQIATQGLQNAS